LNGPDEDKVILLAFAWNDNDSRIRFEMFAELMVADLAHSTNKEEFPFLSSQALIATTKHILFLGFTCQPRPDGC
jgi:hypothetical protein